METRGTGGRKEDVGGPTIDHTAIFIEKYLQAADPKFERLRAVYSTKKGKFVEAGEQGLASISETDEMRHQQKLFLGAVKKFESSEHGMKSKVRWNSASNLKWSDIIEELRCAEDRYAGVGEEGVLGRTRACLRTAKSLRAPCEQWLQVGAMCR